MFSDLHVLEIVYLGCCAGMLALNLFALWLGGWWFRVAVLERPPLPRDYRPLASLIIPCKGAEEGLGDHLAAHFRYDYPRYEIVFAVADEADPAAAVIREQIAKHPHIAARVVVAPRINTCVEKISNQLGAIEATDPRSEVFAFADSDGTPNPAFLGALVTPLQKDTVTTGFRWYFPEGGAFTGNLQSAWDSNWLFLHAFQGTVWGGAMAITRKTFEEWDLAAHLSKGITDDLILHRRCREMGGTVFFAAGAMVGSRAYRRFADFWRWAVRQSALVRFVFPRFYIRGFTIANLYGSFWLLTILLLILPGNGLGRVLPASALGVMLVLSVIRSGNRYLRLRQLFPGWEEKTRPLRWRYVWYVPLSDLLAPFVVYASLFGRTIRWRGVGYRVLADRVERVGGLEPPRPLIQATMEPAWQRRQS